MKRLLALVGAIATVAATFAAKVEYISVPTEFLAAPDSVTVIVPDVAAERPCPTVYLLHGYGDTYRGWSTRTRPDLPELADRYGFIFVMPDGRDSWYWDSPIDSTMQMESFITADLVPYVDSHYNTVADPSKRAITGLSMGGHGAMWLAMRHPDIWANVGSMSGGLDIKPFPKNWKIKDRIGPEEAAPEVWRQHSVIDQVPNLKGGQLNIIFDCGVDDFFFDVNNRTHQALLDAGIPHDYTVRPGGHSHPYWANSLLYHLLFFNENFNK